MSNDLTVIIVVLLLLALAVSTTLLVIRKRKHDSNMATVEDSSAAVSLEDAVDETPHGAAKAELNWYQRQRIRLEHHSQARNAYKSARGTHHRTLLNAALKQQQQLQKAAQMEIAVIERKLLQLQKQEQVALDGELQKWIATTQLREVPGIGAKRYEQLMHNVFNGRLDDFLHAKNRVPGIGEATQAALNRWVYNYKQRLPGLMLGDFPGKLPITSAYAQKREVLLTEQRALETRIVALIAAQDPIECELAWLNQVNLRAFQQTYKREDPQVDRYMLGVFAEWEKMPEWFRSVMTTEK